MIIIEDSTLTQKGHHEIKLSFEVVVTAEEARHKVRWWLRDHVGMLLDADPPTLAVGEKTVWRVPIFISFSHTGRFSTLGMAEVDARTGEIINPEGTQKTMEAYYENEVKDKVPPYKPRESIPEEFIAKHLSPAPKPKVITFDKNDS